MFASLAFYETLDIAAGNESLIDLERSLSTC